MKKLIFASILGLVLIAFTGCTTSDNANMGAKCSASSKCSGTKKCAASGKCDSAKKVAKKCAAGKCGK